MRKYRKVLFWFLLGLAAQAALLSTIDAGRPVHHQHYRPAQAHPAILAFLALQTAVVGAGIRRSALHRKLSVLKLRQWVLIGGLFVLSSAAPSRDPGFYAAELLFASLVQAVQLGNILLIASALPSEFSIQPFLDSRRFTLGAAAWVVLASAILNVTAYERHPHLADEVCYLVQARYLAEGRLYLPAPPIPQAFDVDLMTLDNDRWFSIFPPGWPAVLALGVWLGIPWMVNPLLAGICIFLAERFLRSLYDVRTARWSILLLACSPWFLFLAMSFMAHICALAFSLAAALAALRKRFFWSGMALGWLFLVRPLEAAALGALLGVWILKEHGWKPPVIWLAAGTAITGSLHFVYNKILTGSAGLFPVMDYFDRHFGPGSNQMGFGPNRGANWPIDPSPGHGVSDALINAALNLASLNTELFGWGTGSLLILVLFLVTGKQARKTADLVMLAAIAAIFTAHFFYWFSGGPDFGARYWFLMIVPCVALAARGLHHLERSLTPAVSRAAPALIAMALLTFIPWRASDKYHHYLEMRPDARRLAGQERFGRALIFVRGRRFPDYASAFVENSFDLQSGAPVYVWDRDPQTRARVLEAFPGRPVWTLDGPTITGGGFRVSERPPD